MFELPKTRGTPGPGPAAAEGRGGVQIRPIVKLRISNFGVWAKRILKRRSLAFLAHRLIS